jgi:hypothetical protein
MMTTGIVTEIDTYYCTGIALDGIAEGSYVIWFQIKPIRNLTNLLAFANL